MFRHPWNCPDCDEVPITTDQTLDVVDMSPETFRRSFADTLTAMESR